MIDFAQIKGLSTASRFPKKNTVVIKEGDVDTRSMYIILQGEVRVVKNYGKVDQVLLTHLGPGDFFGEASLFLAKPRIASVVTSDDDTVLLEINHENVFDVIENNPKMLYGLIKALCARIDDLNERVPLRTSMSSLT